MAGERQISVATAQTLLAQGYSYLDVRSEVEFEQGHVPGAYNVPFMHPLYDELVPNLDFLQVMEIAFAKDSALIVGCHSGNRSKLTTLLLGEAGYTCIAELSVGWDGNRDAFGRINPGWSRLGLPIELGSGGSRSYLTLKQLLSSKRETR